MSDPQPTHPGPNPDEALREPAKGRNISCTPLVAPYLFAEEFLERVKDFECGSHPYAIEVANWIKAPRGGGGALDDMENNGTQVWLYETAAGELVGYGSLGQTQWRWDNPKKGPWTPILIIPFYGVQTPFQRQPPGPKEDRYSRRIFEDLLSKAVSHKDGRRLLGLFVHPENTAAVRLYRDFGFMDYGTTKQGYLRMIVDLRGPDGSPPLPPVSA